MAKSALAVMLFAQAALAYAACDMRERAPARAVSAAIEMPCPEHKSPGEEEMNVNLCLVHCTSNLQNVDTAGLTFPSAASFAALTLASARVHRCIELRSSRDSCTFAGPPVRILIHNLRI